MSGDVVLVTGAAGFIGSNIARAFAERGDAVVACDRMGQDERWRNLADINLHDLITPEALPDWLHTQAGRVKLVVHMGAISATTETNIDLILRDNIRATLDLWQWCTQHKATFIYASSAATYGDGQNGFEDRDDLPYLSSLRPMNAYGWSKLMVDRRVMTDKAQGRPTPPSWAGLKFFNVYGPGEDHKGDMRSVVNKVMPGVAAGEAVRLFRSDNPDYADGGQMRDFVYVDDIVAVVLWLSEQPAMSGLFNVGSGQARSWNDLAHAVFAALNKPARIEYFDMPAHLRKHYQYFTQASIDKLRRAGWNGALTGLEEGVRRYAQARPESLDQ